MNTDRSYAHAEVIENGASWNMMVPVEGPGSVMAAEQTIQKQSQALMDRKPGAFPWAQPRMAFDVLLGFLDMNIWHKRCVYLKAALMAGLGWELVTEDEDKGEDSAYDQIMDFLEHPNENDEETFTRLCFRCGVDYFALGNLFMEAARTMGGPAGNLYHRRAVTMRRDKEIREGGYWQTLNNKRVHFSRWGRRRGGRNEILHHYVYDPADDYYGAPDWLPALADMFLDRSAVEFNINLFRNQLVAKFAVIVEGGRLSPKGREGIRTFIQRNATGTHNAGRTIVLDTDDPGVKIKIEKLEMDFGDKQNFMGKTRDGSRDHVVAAHGVPPRMVGIMQAGQLGGGGEITGQLKTFLENEINPQQTMFEDFLNRTVIASFGEHKWRLRFLDMDVTDPKVDAEVEEILTRSGIKLKVESREALGLPQIDEQELAERSGQGGMPAGFEHLARQLERVRKDLGG